ncbi:hypothetical protein F4780DRAFT_776975 [Xylariomycetidae sp. FL0641]|nr:hypothetical protein F4780DRAFT_776975 [Xylariomycetidae sp. FL0641]
MPKNQYFIRLFTKDGLASYQPTNRDGQSVDSFQLITQDDPAFNKPTDAEGRAAYSFQHIDEDGRVSCIPADKKARAACSYEPITKDHYDTEHSQDIRRVIEALEWGLPGRSQTVTWRIFHLNVCYHIVSGGCDVILCVNPTVTLPTDPGEGHPRRSNVLLQRLRRLEQESPWEEEVEVWGCKWKFGTNQLYYPARHNDPTPLFAVIYQGEDGTTRYDCERCKKAAGRKGELPSTSGWGKVEWNNAGLFLKTDNPYETVSRRSRVAVTQYEGGDEYDCADGEAWGRAQSEGGDNGNEDGKAGADGRSRSSSSCSDLSGVGGSSQQPPSEENRAAV